jgi:hypothetical protein
MLKITSSIQSILGGCAVLIILFSLVKVFSPGIIFKLVSNYYTHDRDNKGLFILKVQTISNVDLVLENVVVNLTFNNGTNIKMIPYSVRWKGTCFKMLDINKQERDYKLLNPLEPDLRMCGIKQGNNECYICMKSEQLYHDVPIKSWSFELKYRQYLLPVPNIPWFNRKTITVLQPEGKDLYFDDSLFQKISPEERQKLLNEL